MTNYNKTQLNVDADFEKMVFHRDYFAHFLRWSHVVKMVKPKKTRVLDVGCGTGNLAKTLWHNRRAPAAYLGVDVRGMTINKNAERYEDVAWAHFLHLDICREPLPRSAGWPGARSKRGWDLVVCFEVLEHVGKQNAWRLLENLASCMGEQTVLLLSTPVFDRRMGAAANHMIDGEVGEFEYDELDVLLQDYFKIENVWGTFASQRDYKPHMSPAQLAVYKRLHDYYHAEVLSVLMAPMFPEHSRNCVWRCRPK